MMAKKRLASFYMLVLVGMLVSGTVLIWKARGQTPLQIAIGVITAGFYILWGILRHWQEGDLHPKIVVEYVLVAAIAVVLLLTLAV